MKMAAKGAGGTAAGTQGMAGTGAAGLKGPGAPRMAALMVTGLEGTEAIAAELAGKLGITVEMAGTRGAALRLLERRSYAVVILDQQIVDADPEGVDLVWAQAGLAIPLQVSFGLTGSARVEREVRAALARRQRETLLATAAASAGLDAEIKNAVTGFLLESQLALAEDGIPPRVEIRLRTLEGIAARLRERLGGTPLESGARVELRTGLQPARG
ncbi:MAG: hypothetical protein WA414_13640 [Acidobacteriaceae bacterium]